VFDNSVSNLFGDDIATPSGLAEVEKAALLNLAEHLSGHEVKQVDESIATV